MSVNIIAELNPLSSKRTALEVEPETVADILTKLGAGFPLSQARVCRNGEIVTDFSIRAEDGDALSIKFVPYGGSPEGAGRGMKAGGIGLMILGAISIGVFGWTGIGGMVGTALIGSGLSMALGGAVLLNINIPSLKDPEKPENDPSIRGGKNQARPLGRIPVLFGRHRLYPDVAANPFTSIIGNQQYFTQLFCGGYKDCVVDPESFKLGETPIVELSQSKSVDAILSGADPVVRAEILQNGEASELYPYCVHEDAVNAPLQNQIEDGDGNKRPGELVRATPPGTDTINVDIFLYNGIGKYNGEGNLGSASVEVKASYKSADDPEAQYAPLGTFTPAGDVLSGAELKTKRYQITKEGLAPGKYTVKVERVTPDSTNSKVIDTVYAGSIRSIKSRDEFGRPARPINPERQKDLTVVALRVMATAKVNNVIDSFNYVARSKLPVHSGTGSGPLYWLLSAETRNPAAMLLYALRGRAAQQQVDPDDIDWTSLEAFYEWCGAHEYTCDAYLSEAVAIAELLRRIGSTARADILRTDSKISVVRDIERPSPVQLFTPKNTKGYSVTMFNADVPDAIALRFADEDAGYAQNEAKVFNTPNGKPTDTSPKTIQKTDLWGVTGSAQARRIGMYNYACLKHRPFVHTIEVDIEYLLCNKGDRILYAGDLALTGAAQGRIVEVLRDEEIGRAVGLRLDEPAVTEPGKQYAARLRRSDGTVLLKDVAAVQAPDRIYFTEPFEKNDVPEPGDVYAFGIRGQEVVDLIITDIQPQADLSATLTCVEYGPAIFGVDDPDFVLPEFENKITPVSGAVDSGVVSTADWRLFIVYHDDEEEPPRPGGDGQTDGWHYAHTSSALWQSSKTAESVDSGEWGPPARIKGERGTGDTVPVYLTLTPQTKILETDSNGAILAGLLPFTSRAALFRWNHRIPAVAGIERFPGTGGDLFDPMLGDFVPTTIGLTYSLVDPPRGVSIARDGLITVAADAALEDEHSITVQAEFEGAVYSAALFIQVKKRAGEANYLGTAEAIEQHNAKVFIVKGNPESGWVRAIPGHYVLAVANGTVGAWVWRMGYVYQWTGVAWEERDPDKYGDLYMLCFKDGLEVQALTQNMGWFGNLFAGQLFALRAFIERLETQVITLREGGIIKSANFDDNNGWMINFRGDAIFNKLTARGDSLFMGDINSGRLYSSSKLTGEDTPGKTFFSYETARDVHYHYGSFENYSSTEKKTTVPVPGGAFGGFGVIQLTLRSKGVGIGNSVYAKFWVDITVQDNSVITRSWASHSSERHALGSELSIGGGSRGATLMLDLPLNAVGLERNAVYKDPAGFIRIVT